MSSQTHHSVSLADVARHVDAEVSGGAGGLRIVGLNSLDLAGAGELSFCVSRKYAASAAATKASAVLVSADDADADVGDAVRLVVPDAAKAADRVLELFAFEPDRPDRGVDPAARVHPTVTLASGVRVGPHAVVGPRCVVGRGTILHAGVVLGADVVVGEGCELFAGVVVRDRCTLGHRVVLHAGCVIGTDGFGYRFDGKAHRKIPHVGRVVVEDDVEVGSCTTIDRGKFAETRIGEGTKIDNLVQIGHNVRMGRHCIVCANVGIAGSTTLGDGVILAGGAGLKDHIHVGSGARIAAYTGVGNDVPPGQTLMGALYAMPQKQFLREQAVMRKLPDMLKKLRELEGEIETLKAALPGK